MSGTETALGLAVFAVIASLIVTLAGLAATADALRRLLDEGAPRDGDGRDGDA